MPAIEAYGRPPKVSETFVLSQFRLRFLTTASAIQVLLNRLYHLIAHPSRLCKLRCEVALNFLELLTIPVHVA